MKTLTFTGGNICVRAAFGLLFLGGLAQASPIAVFNTGVNAGGAVLPNGTVGDPHYTLITVPGGTTELRIGTDANGYPVGTSWLGDNSLSRWIGPNSDAEFNGPAGIYEYRTVF